MRLCSYPKASLRVVVTEMCAALFEHSARPSADFSAFGYIRGCRCVLATCGPSTAPCLGEAGKHNQRKAAAVKHLARYTK